MKFLETDVPIIGLAVVSILFVGLACTATAAEQSQVESGIAVIHSGKTGKTKTTSGGCCPNSDTQDGNLGH